jgi:hypothetical protein
MLCPCNKAAVNVTSIVNTQPQGSISSTFLVKSKWQKAQSRSKLQKKIEVCAQKILKDFLAHGNERKAAFLSFAQKSLM